MPRVLAVIADDGTVVAFLVTLLAVISHRWTTTATPATLDPDVTIAAVIPATLFPLVADALALVIAVAPDPATTAADPAPLDEHEPGACLHHDRARRRRLFVDLDRGNRLRRHDVTMCFDHAAGRATDQRRDERETSETVL
jgi:hypothetical protein